MSSKVVSVAVRQPDGVIKQVERRVFFSHYGPILNLPGFGWTAKRAVTIRDANANNVSSSSQWLAMNRARSLEEFKQAHAEYNAMPGSIRLRPAPTDARGMPTPRRRLSEARRVGGLGQAQRD